MQTRETKNIKYHLTERHIYGSARLGMDRTMVEMAPTLIQAYPLEPTIPATEESERYLGRKYYELSNHLGNVLTVITDEKRMILDGNNYSHYESVVVSVTDYSPFGVSITGRTFTTTEGYRYGFNGQEKESEITGTETHMSAEFWMYDARAGRRWQLDPKPNESWSEFSCFQNSPIAFFDALGDTTLFFDINNGSFLGQLNDQSRTNYMLINPNIYNKKMEGVDFNVSNKNADWASNTVSDLISTAENLELTRDDGFEYLARESEQYLFIGLTEGRGTLEWRVRFDNTAQITVGTWSSQSSNKKGDSRHPEGTFKLDNLRWRTDNKSLIRDNVGFTIDIEDLGNIWDPDLNRNRDYMEIHPDGEANGNWQNNNGTAGCIGLQSNASELMDFYNRASSYFSNTNHKSMNLNVVHND